MTKRIGCDADSSWNLGGFLTNSGSPKKFRSQNKKLHLGSTQPPDCVVIMDTQRKSLVIFEAEKLQIPIVGLVNSNTPWDVYMRITYPIPANDSVKFVYLFCNLITKTFLVEKKKVEERGTKLLRLTFLVEQKKVEERGTKLLRLTKTENGEESENLKQSMMSSSKDEDLVIPYESLALTSDDPVETKQLLDKLAVIKLNGALGTKMGFSGPRSAIEVCNGVTYLDLIINQIEVGFWSFSFVGESTCPLKYGLTEDVEDVESNKLTLSVVGVVRNLNNEEVEESKDSVHGIDASRVDVDQRPLIPERVLYLDNVVVEKSNDFIPVDSSHAAVDSDSDDYNLVSADPLIKFVDFIRIKKKHQSLKGNRRKPFWSKNPLKVAMFSGSISRDRIDCHSRRLKLGSKKGRVDGSLDEPPQSAHEEVCSDSRKRNSNLVKRARDSMKMGARLGVKYRGRESFNIKKLVEMKGIVLSEQEIIEVIKDLDILESNTSI